MGNWACFKNQHTELMRLSKPSPELKRLSKPKLKKVNTDKIPEFFSPECIICLEIKDEIMVTKCWCQVVCNGWAQKIKSWPQKCMPMNKLFVKSKPIIKHIMKMTETCKYWQKEYPLIKADQHKYDWWNEMLDDIEHLPALHFHELTKKSFTSTQSWSCYWTKSTNMDHVDGDYKEAYYCSKCDVNICKLWVIKTMLQINSENISPPTVKREDIKEDKKEDKKEDLSYSTESNMLFGQYLNQAADTNQNNMNFEHLSRLLGVLLIMFVEENFFIILNLQSYNYDLIKLLLYI